MDRARAFIPDSDRRVRRELGHGGMAPSIGLVILQEGQVVSVHKAPSDGVYVMPNKGGRFKVNAGDVIPDGGVFSPRAAAVEAVEDAAVDNGVASDGGQGGSLEVATLDKRPEAGTVPIGVQDAPARTGERGRAGTSEATVRAGGKVPTEVTATAGALPAAGKDKAKGKDKGKAAENAGDADNSEANVPAVPDAGVGTPVGVDPITGDSVVVPPVADAGATLDAAESAISNGVVRGADRPGRGELIR